VWGGRFPEEMSRNSFVAADFLRKWAEKFCGRRFLKEMSRNSLWRPIPQGNEHIELTLRKRKPRAG